MMVMYVSGTVSMSEHRVLLWLEYDQGPGRVHGGVCDFNEWTPNTSMFMFVAGGTASP